MSLEPEIHHKDRPLEWSVWVQGFLPARKFSAAGMTFETNTDQSFNPLSRSSQNSYTVNQGFDARLANRPFLVFDFSGTLADNLYLLPDALFM